MPIEDFLVDFYSKNTDQEIDQAKIDSIVDHYNGDNASMMKDLYEKYDNGNIDNEKFLEIKEYYSIDLPEQGEVVEETTIQETESEKPKMTKVGSDISFEEFNNIEEDPLIEELEKKYGDYLEFNDPYMGSGYINDVLEVTNKKTGEEIRLNLNTEYNAGRGAEFSDEKGYSVYKDFLSFANKARFNEEGSYWKQSL